MEDILSSSDPVYSVNEPLIKSSKGHLKIYRRRWYILFLFTSVAALFNVFWNTWSPIQEPCKAVFGWSDRDIILINLWSGVSYFVTAAPFVWLMDTKGIRISILLAVFLMVAGKVIQCIPFANGTFRTVMVNIGQFIIMASAPVPMGGPPLVSATWFPSHERTTSTAIGTLGSYIGIAIGFAFGPALVPTRNGTVNSRTGNATQDITFMQGRISDYLWLEAGVALFLFLLILVYFPSHPPSPPTISSSTNHLSGKAGLMVLLKSRSFWVIAGLCGLNFGVYFGWMSVLDVMLSKFDVDQRTAGWLGCAGTLAGVLPGILLARFADFIQHKTKQILVCLLICTVVAQVIFTLSCIKILPSTNAILFTAIISSGLFFSGTVPLFLELSVECVYPVAEGITGVIVILAGNVVLLVFYTVFMLPHSNVSWMNWVLVGGVGITIPALLIYREKYPRLDLDTFISGEPESRDKSMKSV